MRILLRDDMAQMQLEKTGVAVIPFLHPGNEAWIWNLLSSNDPMDASGYATDLFVKFQGKVEYRCINCSPINFTITPVHSYLAAPFNLLSSITDERKFQSLHLFVPISKDNRDKFDVAVLKGANHLVQNPRIHGLQHSFTQVEQQVRAAMQIITIKAGQALVIDRRVPFYWQGDNYFLLEAPVLPYEAPLQVLQAYTSNGNCFIKPYLVTPESYSDGILLTDLPIEKMRPLREVCIQPHSIQPEEIKDITKRATHRNWLQKALQLLGR